jgi:hypothetical protein
MVLRDEYGAARACGAAFWLKRLSYLAIIVAGILLVASSSAVFGVLVITIVLLLLVSLRNTWDLLVTVADVTQ